VADRRPTLASLPSSEPLPPAHFRHPQRRPSQPGAQGNPDAMVGDDHQGGNVLSFASKGANEGAGVVVSIVAIAIAFVSAIAFLNALLSHLFGLVGYPFITFEYLLGLVFTPLAFVLGFNLALPIWHGAICNRRLLPSQAFPGLNAARWDGSSASRWSSRSSTPSKTWAGSSGAA